MEMDKEDSDEAKVAALGQVLAMGETVWVKVSPPSPSPHLRRPGVLLFSEELLSVCSTASITCSNLGQLLQVSSGVARNTKSMPVTSLVVGKWYAGQTVKSLKLGVTEQLRRSSARVGFRNWESTQGLPAQRVECRMQNSKVSGLLAGGRHNRCDA